MPKIATKTKLSPEEAIKQAIEFFGPDGYGLELKERAPSCAYFEGGGGGVRVYYLCRGKTDLCRVGIPGVGLSGQEIHRQNPLRGFCVGDNIVAIVNTAPEVK